MSDADLLDALRDCYDPVLRRNIVDARLVRSATLTPDLDAPGASVPGVGPRFLARVTLTAPGSDEIANAQLLAQIENRLLGLQAISRVEVTLLPALFPIL
jgi:metal-sulfur cluster biosynthetic enzyme